MASTACPAPGEVLAQALHISSPPDGVPPLLPEHEAMQKLRPLMNSLKQACGYDRSWAPAVHQLLHKILATVSLHTRPLQKLFCPCCTSHKNRVLFGHYYNNDTLVCKRCSTKFRELVSGGKMHPKTNAFHARLVAVMDPNLVGKRKRQSRGKKRRGSDESADTRNSKSAADSAEEETVSRRVKAPRRSSFGTIGKVEEEVDNADAGSAVSSGSNTDNSVTAVGLGLWGDVSGDSSEPEDSIVPVPSFDSAPIMFHDYFDAELSYSLNDMPLFGATPEDVPARPSSNSVDSHASDDFDCALASLPKLSLNDPAPTSPTFMTRDQFASLVSVRSCNLIPVDAAGCDREVALDRSQVGCTAPAGSYLIKLNLHGATPTPAMVSAMVVNLPTEYSLSEGRTIPQRIQWDKASSAKPTSFRDTLFPVTASGTTELMSAVPFAATAHSKLAVVVFVTSPEAARFTTYTELRQNGVAMLPAGGYFDVLPVDEE